MYQWPNHRLTCLLYYLNTTYFHMKITDQELRLSSGIGIGKHNTGTRFFFACISWAQSQHARPLFWWRWRCRGRLLLPCCPGKTFSNLVHLCSRRRWRLWKLLAKILCVPWMSSVWLYMLLEDQLKSKRSLSLPALLAQFAEVLLRGAYEFF